VGVSDSWLKKADEILKPDGDRPWRPFVASMIAEAVEDLPNPVIVDAGCGVASWMLDSAGVRKGIKLGLDVDPDARKNKSVDLVALSSVEDMPIRSESADLIISSYVLEHLEHPEKAFREFARVLKPGGTLILWASNKWNYAMVLSSLTPTWFHNWVRRIALKNIDKDNYPTYYRVNTARMVRARLQEAVLKEKGIFFGANAYRYWGFSKILFILAALGSRVVSATPLRCLKSILIVRAKKP
jgi:ubiquinone/menaquinone biosynthesis C-methylase UbiE